ncbi:hypothetical protein ACMT1E_15045 [Sphingomonas flavalba]|uniref:hypothetical protein n=1 Tax=Sphingomonas flavalba TaxID=2559804 RepID=UPI0039E1EF70
MIDYHSPRFKTSEVARAAGIPAPTFRSYFSRQQFRVIGEMSQKADIFGLPNLFSLTDALGFAVAVRLISIGADPKSAWEVAMLKFAHTGDEDRPPAHMFDIHEKGETLLIYWPDEGKGRLVAANDVDLISAMGLSWGQPNAVEAANTILLNPIEQRVFAALGIAS